jgi:hypothetical protein
MLRTILLKIIREFLVARIGTPRNHSPDLLDDQPRPRHVHKNINHDRELHLEHESNVQGTVTFLDEVGPHEPRQCTDDASVELVDDTTEDECDSNKRRVHIVIDASTFQLVGKQKPAGSHEYCRDLEEEHHDTEVDDVVVWPEGTPHGLEAKDMMNHGLLVQFRCSVLSVKGTILVSTISWYKVIHLPERNDLEDAHQIDEEVPTCHLKCPDLYVADCGSAFIVCKEILSVATDALQTVSSR